jgi:hypothetical protein
MSMTGDRRREVILAACGRGQLDLEQLWFRYVALGGDAAPLELEAYLVGLMPLDDHQYDILAHTINERLGELGLPRDVPYARPWSAFRRRPNGSGDQRASPPG